MVGALVAAVVTSSAATEARAPAPPRTRPGVPRPTGGRGRTLTLRGWNVEGEANAAAGP